MPDTNQEIRSILQRWQRADHIQLHAGEMSAQEMRSVRAVLRAAAAEVGAYLPADAQNVSANFVRTANQIMKKRMGCSPTKGQINE